MTDISERVAHEVAGEWDEAWRSFLLDAEARLAVADEALAKAGDILAVVIESYPDALDDSSALLSVEVLQELGEGYALISEWPIRGGTRPSMPNRALVERTVRLAGLDVLAPIEMATPVSDVHRRSRWRSGQMSPARERKLAHDLAGEFSGYAMFLAIVGSNRGRVEFLKQRIETRGTVSGAISLGRRLYDLLVELPERGGALRQAVLLGRLLTDSQFLATTVDSLDGYRDMSVLPIDFVRDYIRDTGVDTWLAHHGAQLSDDVR